MKSTIIGQLRFNEKSHLLKGRPLGQGGVWKDPIDEPRHSKRNQTEMLLGRQSQMGSWSWSWEAPLKSFLRWGSLNCWIEGPGASSLSQVNFEVYISQLSQSHLSSVAVGGITPALFYLQSTESHMRDEPGFGEAIRFGRCWSPNSK